MPARDISSSHPERLEGTATSCSLLSRSAFARVTGSPCPIFVAYARKQDLYKIYNFHHIRPFSVNGEAPITTYLELILGYDRQSFGRYGRTDSDRYNCVSPTFLTRVHHRIFKNSDSMRARGQSCGFPSNSSYPAEFLKENCIPCELVSYRSSFREIVLLIF